MCYPTFQAMVGEALAPDEAFSERALMRKSIDRSLFHLLDIGRIGVPSHSAMLRQSQFRMLHGVSYERLVSLWLFILGVVATYSHQNQKSNQVHLIMRATWYHTLTRFITLHFEVQTRSLVFHSSIR